MNTVSKKIPQSSSFLRDNLMYDPPSARQGSKAPRLAITRTNNLSISPCRYCSCRRTETQTWPPNPLFTNKNINSSNCLRSLGRTYLFHAMNALLTNKFPDTLHRDLPFRFI